MKTALRNAAAVAALGAAIAAPLAAVAASDHRTFDGVVVHISSNNIKVQGSEGGKLQTLSFEYVPRIGKLTHNHGQVTADQRDLHVGEYVRVTFDQKLLGLRHADSVEAEANPAAKMKS